MSDASMFMGIAPGETDAEFFHQTARGMGCKHADVVMGGIGSATAALAARTTCPQYLLIDIKDSGKEILPDLDSLAEHCEPGTRVILIGSINDVTFYRELRLRGVLEYFVAPAKVADICAAFRAADKLVAGGGGKVITFMSAASGDGASTIALNTAYAIATETQKSVVLVDMDYQFGMVAKNLDLMANFGIKELFEHPERGIDATLIKRMILPYGSGKLDIIAAPNELRAFPTLLPETIHDLLSTLRQEYDVIVLDLPHLWMPWVASTLSLATHVVMVAQLWLRSVTHSARLLNVWRSTGISNDKISLVVNRSGAKFKEAISARDFERVCNLSISHYFINDIRSIVSAENHGRTILEGNNAAITKQLKDFAADLMK